MQILKTFDNYFTAHIWLKKFEDEGFHCFLKDENSVTINPIMSNALGGIKLMAHDSEVEKAFVLLKEFEKEYLQSAKCPKCNQKRMLYIAKPSPKNILISFATWLFASYAVPVDYVYQCQKCKFESCNLP